MSRSKVLLLAFLAAVACRPRPEPGYAVKIANGVPTEAHPSVVGLVNTETGGLCTGTFVRPKVLITAAHCFQDRNAKDLAYGEHVPVRAVHGGILGDPAALRPDDLAVVEFARSVAPALAPLTSVAPKPGDEVMVVGFGRLATNDPDSTGVKREGKNQVLAVEGGFAIVEGVAGPVAGLEPGSAAVGARGDSGGPLFVRGQLTGVGSGGGATAEGFKRTRYVDLTAPKARAILCRALPLGDCPRPEGGPAPLIPDPPLCGTMKGLRCPPGLSCAFQWHVSPVMAAPDMRGYCVEPQG